MLRAVWLVMLLAGAAQAKGRAAEKDVLVADRVLPSRHGDLPIRRGAIAWHEWNGKRLLAEGTLSRAHALGGIRLPEGSRLVLYDIFGGPIRVELPAGARLRLGGVELGGRLTLNLDAPLRVGGELVNDVVVEGIAFARGTELGLSGTPPAMTDARLEWGTVARAPQAAAYPVEAGDELLIRRDYEHGRPIAEPVMIVAFGDRARLLEGKYQATHSAYYGRDSGKLHSFHPAPGSRIHGVLVASEPVRLWPDGTPQVFAVDGPSPIQGLRLGYPRTEIWWWPNGRVLCAYLDEQDPRYGRIPLRRRDGNRNYASVYFSPDGEPRLLALDEAYEQDDSLFEVKRNGTTWAFTRLSASHPLRGRFYRDCRNTGHDVIAWLRGR